MYTYKTRIPGTYSVTHMLTHGKRTMNVHLLRHTSVGKRWTCTWTRILSPPYVHTGGHSHEHVYLLRYTYMTTRGVLLRYSNVDNMGWAHKWKHILTPSHLCWHRMNVHMNTVLILSFRWKPLKGTLYATRPVVTKPWSFGNTTPSPHLPQRQLKGF